MAERNADDVNPSLSDMIPLASGSRAFSAHSYMRCMHASSNENKSIPFWPVSVPGRCQVEYRIRFHRRPIRARPFWCTFYDDEGIALYAPVSAHHTQQITRPIQRAEHTVIIIRYGLNEKLHFVFRRLFFLLLSFFQLHSWFVRRPIDLSMLTHVL